MANGPEFNFGVQKVHGFTAVGTENLTSNFEFITVVASNDIRTFAQSLVDAGVTPLTANAGQLAAANASQACLDKLIQIISERGQPVMMGTVAAGNKTVQFAIEHARAWECLGDTYGNIPSWVSTNNALHTLANQIALDGVNVMAADGVTPAPLTATVTFSSVIGGPFA